VARSEEASVREHGVFTLPPFWDRTQTDAVNFIYVLRDPFTWERRYIGKSKDPIKRYKDHIKPYYLRPDTYKNRWLRGLLAEGRKPILEILCEAGADEDINQLERDFIRWFRPNWPLTNTTDGGDGGPTWKGRKMPPRGPSPMRGVKWAPDDPRRKFLRENQTGMHAERAATIAREHHLRYWKVTSPSGEWWILRGLGDFCAKHGLSLRKMYAVAAGDEGRTHHRGWRCEKLTHSPSPVE
jgi:hypothetical protein